MQEEGKGPESYVEVAGHYSCFLEGEGGRQCCSCALESGLLLRRRSLHVVVERLVELLLSSQLLLIPGPERDFVVGEYDGLRAGIAVRRKLGDWHTKWQNINV